MDDSYAPDSVIVYCGNGGDFEYEHDKHIWISWLTMSFGHSKFVIRPHRDADKAVIYFFDGRDLTWFLLNPPKYINGSYHAGIYQ